MIKIILHGGYAKTDNELNRNFIKEIGQSLPKNFNLLFVFFAIDKARYKYEYEEHGRIFSNILKNKNPKFTLATEENFLEQIKKAQAIYLRGGNIIKLLKIIEKYPDFKALIKDKVVAGSSAGAYLLAKYSYGNDEGKKGVFTGLGILPIKLACHFVDKEKELIIKELNKYSEDMDLVLLKDFEHKVYEI